METRWTGDDGGEAEGGTMDGKPHFQRAVAADRPDNARHLQAFYGHSYSDWQTSTVPTSYGPQSSSDPGLDETRAMPTAP